MRLHDIRTERLVLTPLRMEFLDSVCSYAADIDNAEMMVFLPISGRDEAQEFIIKAEAEIKKPQPLFIEYAVLLSGEHIGGFTVYFEDHPDSAELGWIVRRDRWGEGITAEAAKAVVDYFNREHGINRFFAQCDSENRASRRVMEKLGMTYSGCHGGRFNRSDPDVERTELVYELIVEE